jgi:hypothetical protein
MPAYAFLLFFFPFSAWLCACPGVGKKCASKSSHDNLGMNDSARKSTEKVMTNFWRLWTWGKGKMQFRG